MNEPVCSFPVALWTHLLYHAVCHDLSAKAHKYDQIDPSNGFDISCPFLRTAQLSWGRATVGGILPRLRIPARAPFNGTRNKRWPSEGIALTERMT